MKNNLSETPLWEKLTGLIGFLLICSTVGYLLWAAMSNDNEPPNIHFNVITIESLEKQYLVLVDVENIGDTTATVLYLEGQLKNADGLVQRSTAQVNYLASQSIQRVGFYFKSNPAEGALSFIPLNYQEP
jgi:uncharacterized protein (TIGR02588 family)